PARIRELAAGHLCETEPGRSDDDGGGGAWPRKRSEEECAARLEEESLLPHQYPSLSRSDRNCLHPLNAVMNHQALSIPHLKGVKRGVTTTPMAVNPKSPPWGFQDDVLPTLLHVHSRSPGTPSGKAPTLLPAT
ncbi:hypothetical protein NHX12_013272, partial [Muraenolepis orangiensis]